VTQENLTARAAELGFSELKQGYTLVDLDLNDWWYNDEEAAWIDIGQSTVSQFTDTTAGTILGSGDSLKVSANADGTGSVNNAVPAIVTDWDPIVTDVDPTYQTKITNDGNEIKLFAWGVNGIFAKNVALRVKKTGSITIQRDDGPEQEIQTAENVLIKADYDATEEVKDAGGIVAAIINMVYPVGSLYTSFTSDVSPSVLLGVGTWVQIDGRVIVGYSATTTQFNSPGKIGGELTHVLTAAEMPSLAHTEYDVMGTGTTDGGPAYATGLYWHFSGNPTGDTGGNIAHNNVQPYITAYMWQRTA
jgi:hypothetical protein